MGLNGTLLMNLLFVLLFWGISIWVFNYRNRPAKIDSVLPMVPKFRKGRLHSLIRYRGDVVWFALWLFLVGCLFLVSLLINIANMSM